MDEITQVINTSTNKAVTRTIGKPDSLNSEFLYYSSVLKIIAPALSSDVDRKKILPWVRKLFSPEYHGSQFREKRNRYLVFITLTVLNDEASNIFMTRPPDGAMIEIEDIPLIGIPAAEWELDNTWNDTLNNLPEDFQTLECAVHENQTLCDDDHHLDAILDQEFQYMLYLAKPYVAMLEGRFESTRGATWLQTLCTIHGEACSSMRGIRNDYMMALLGFIHDLRLAGPFADYPPWKTLPPLAEAAKKASDNKPITHPGNPDASDFISSQPIPNEGAFCYIALTGDLVTSSFGGPAPI